MNGVMKPKETNTKDIRRVTMEEATVRPESKDGATWFTAYVNGTPIISSRSWGEAIMGALIAGYDVREEVRE